MRVCFLIDELATAGTETQLLALLRHLDRSRVQPYLALLRGEGEASRSLEPDCCPVLRLGIGSLRGPATAAGAWRFAQFLWREGVDVVQVYFPDSSYFGVGVAWLAGVRHRVRTRNNVGHWLTWTHRVLGRALNVLATGTIANCEAAREALLRDERPRGESVWVLPNGVDLDRFVGIGPPGDRAVCVGAVANLRPVKGLDVLVDAAARLRDDFPDVHFSIAGEGDERGRLSEQARVGGLEARLHLVGAQKDVPAFLSGLDVAVLPSRAEGMSNAVLEYMAAARPIVATAVGATPELIGECGLLVPPGDAGALAGAIARLLRDRPLARRLGEAARRRAVAEYSREAMVRRFEEFYTSLVGRGEEARSASEGKRESANSPPPLAGEGAVLTDIPGKPGRFWGDHTAYVGPSQPPRWLARLVGWGLAHDLTGAVAAVRMFARRRRAAGVVTDGGASGILFAWLQALAPWGRKPHVMIDCNWYESPSRWRTWLKGLRLRLAARSVRRLVVWAAHEVEDYARTFGLPPDKLEYVPFHTTLDNYTYEVRDDGYLFAGGNYDRDYPTLIEALKALDVPAWIATTRPEQLAGVSVPPHVRVEGTSVAGFRQAMAAARLVVVPMQPGLLHSGGQQTCLNAMYLGKPTIAVGRKWAVDFIRDGEDGLIVDYADAAGLRRAIQWVLEHPEEARRMGEKAHQRAAWFTTERTMRAVYQIVNSQERENASLVVRP